MAHTLAMRATSLAVSAGLLGVVLLVALSASYVVQVWAPPDNTPETSIAEPQRPRDPPPPRPIERPTPITTQQTIIDLPQLPPTQTGPAIPATLPIGSSGPVSIENPRWLEQPRNLARYYPRRAIEREVEGFVLLDCLVATSGLLNCNVISETPSGWNFGDAALRISQDYRMAPATRDGVPVEGRYRMRVPFQLNR